MNQTILVRHLARLCGDLAGIRIGLYDRIDAMLWLQNARFTLINRFYRSVTPSQKKALKQQRKAQKKALKYGLPIAGAAGGAYLLHKGIKHAHHGFHYGSSSSSSSSSSEEE